MIGLFGPHVPKQLNSDADFAELDKVFVTRSPGKVFKAFRLVSINAYTGIGIGRNAADNSRSVRDLRRREAEARNSHGSLTEFPRTDRSL